MKLLTAFCLCIALIFLCCCAVSTKPDFPIVRFSFSHSGISTGSIYTYRAVQTADGWRAELFLLCGAYEHEFSMTGEEAEFLCALIDSCEFWKWNGFDKADRYALDGSSFDLKIDYADGSSVTAHGSNAFPDGYIAAVGEINIFFEELMKAHGIHYEI